MILSFGVSFNPNDCRVKQASLVWDAVFVGMATAVLQLMARVQCIVIMQCPTTCDCCIVLDCNNAIYYDNMISDDMAVVQLQLIANAQSLILT